MAMGSREALETDELLSCQAEERLKEILEKQLDTSVGKAEAIEFIKSERHLRGLDPKFCGIQSLEDYLRNENASLVSNCQRHLNEEHVILATTSEEQASKNSIENVLLDASEEGTTKRPLKRLASSSHFPDHIIRTRLRVTIEEPKPRSENEDKSSNGSLSDSRHLKEIESSLWRGKKSVSGISHLIFSSEPNSRIPLTSKVEEILNSMDNSPLNKLREDGEAKGRSRSVQEIFSEAPEILSINEFLRMKASQPEIFETEGTEMERTECSAHLSGDQRKSSVLVFESNSFSDVRPISDDHVSTCRLTIQEIQNLPNGKFSNYDVGLPSNVLYMKNIHPSVKEMDLVELFLKFQTHPSILFRFMKKGKMRNQAFVTFRDVQTAESALTSRNGYLLKGKPLVISFARRPKCEGSSQG